MSRKERREKEREDMKKIIADAAVQLIIKDGYESLSIRKIANIIEYSPTTIYNYYTDKAAIVSYMVGQLYAKTVAECKKIIEENKDLPVDQIFRLSMHAYLHSIVSEPEMGKAIILSGIDLFSQQGGNETVDETGKSLMVDLLREGEIQGVFRKLDENVALIILTSLLGFALSAIENRFYASAQYDHLITVFSDMILRGILSNEYLIKGADE